LIHDSEFVRAESSLSYPRRESFNRSEKSAPATWGAHGAREEQRFLLRCELDAACFHLYGIGRDDVDYIMETFLIVKRKDEQRYDEYRTKPHPPQPTSRRPSRRPPTTMS
jgi:hypothetical protein